MKPGMKSHIESMIDWLKTDRPRAIEIYGLDLVERVEGANALSRERFAQYFNFEPAVEVRGNVVAMGPFASARILAALAGS